jgi:Protein of unknown function (DUF1566)
MTPPVLLRTALFLSLASVASAGCFRHPKIDDGGKLRCISDDNCLPGYVCTRKADSPTMEFGLCVKPDGSFTDVPTTDVSSIDASRSEAVPTTDGRTGIDGTGGLDGPGWPSDGIPVIDGSQDQPLSGEVATDTAKDLSAMTTDGPYLPDAPIADTISPPPDGIIPDAPITSTGGMSGTGGGPGTGTGGSAGTGGGTSAGGYSGTSGAPFTGGATSTGGVTAAGGIASTGGYTGTGGGGTGGATAGCQEMATKCSGSGVQTCGSGQWGETVACGTNQACEGPEGTAQCKCNVDTVCTTTGPTCATPATIADCAQDAQGCFYRAATTPCDACTGAAGAASCCTNACAVGTRCLSGTSLETCSVATTGCASPTTSTCSSGLVCIRYPPADCADPSWAEWPMPNSQVDVAAGAPNSQSYTDNGDGTVTDNVTGLMWQQIGPTTLYSWTNAIAYCQTLPLAGRDDWRLPTAIELFSIADTGQSNPSIASTFFPSTPAARFWSSTPVANSSSSAWGVYFNYGYAHIYDVTIPYNARCVR